MTSKERNIEVLRQHLAAREWSQPIPVAACENAKQALQGIGGMAGTWRTDYSECTYYHPQRIAGELIDLSTIEKVRAFYEATPTGYQNRSNPCPTETLLSKPSGSIW